MRDNGRSVYYLAKTSFWSVVGRGKMVSLEEKGYWMLRIVIFDSGYGGELLADRLKEELPVAEIVRVIDWRNAKKLQSSARAARSVARSALRPYIGRVDLIVFANYLLTATSLKYFQRKFRGQKFLGVGLTHPGTFCKQHTLILTTTALAKTMSYRRYLLQLRRKVDTLCLDTWPELIDDGELTYDEIRYRLEKFFEKKGYVSDEIILACSQFKDIENSLRQVTRNRAKIYDSSDDVVCKTCQVLKIRGGAVRKSKRKSGELKTRG